MNLSSFPSLVSLVVLSLVFSSWNSAFFTTLISFDFLMLLSVLYASSSALIRELPMNKLNILLYVALLIFLSFNKLLDNMRMSPLSFCFSFSFSFLGFFITAMANSARLISFFFIIFIIYNIRSIFLNLNLFYFLKYK